MAVINTTRSNVIQLAVGTYALSEALTLRTNTHIYGRGYDKTIVAGDINGNAITDVILKDLHFQPSGDYGVKFSNTCGRILIENCKFTTNHYGIFFGDGTDLTIRNCIFSGQDTNGVYIGNHTTGSSQVTIQNCRFSAIVGSVQDRGGSIVVHKCNDLRIIDNDISASGATTGVSHSNAIDVRGSTRVRICRNTILDQQNGPCISVSSETTQVRGDDILIAENTCHGSTTYVGIRTIRADHLRICRNKVDTNYQNGIRVSGSDRLIIAENILKENNQQAASGSTTSSAIWLDGLVYDGYPIINAVISGNIATDSRGASGYGQGNFLRADGASLMQVCFNQFRFGGGSSKGYYFLDLAGGSQSNIIFTRNFQQGAYQLLNGTCDGLVNESNVALAAPA